MPQPSSSPSRRALLALGLGGFAAALLPPGLLRALAQSGAQGGGPGGKARVGIVGSGHIGGAVGTLWAKAGHPVLFSSRHPESLKDLVAAAGPNAGAGTIEEALAFGDVVLLAIPYRAYPEFGGANAKALAGKVVLDAGNATAARDGALADEVKASGIGAVSKKYLPGARVVRAFNTLNYRVLESDAHKTPPIAIPLAGDDAGAVEVAAGLVRDAGFDPVAVGGLDKAAEFQMGAKGYGQQVAAPELRKTLGLNP